MSKNIIICCDGTNNEFGKTNTNVVRLYQCLQRGPGSGQVAFYDPGVGTLALPGWKTKIGRMFSRGLAGAFGAGISENVREVFRFLMVNYEPGDKVYMFGFSRGAYTVRMAAGMLRKCGLPTHGNEALLPYASSIYRQGFGDTEVSRGFRTTFGLPCPVHFLGLWDTVSAVGIMFNPDAFAFTAENDNVAHIRHVMSVDERRGFFRTNRWTEKLPDGPGDPRTLKQGWFPGVHSDVGGGYPDGTLWKHPFHWIVQEAEQKGLKFDHAAVSALLGSYPGNCHQSLPHNSSTLLWRMAGIFPKKHSWRDASGTWRSGYRFSFPRVRTLNPGEPVHRSTLECWRDLAAYRPKNLDPAIINAMIARLQPGDEFLPYES